MELVLLGYPLRRIQYQYHSENILRTDKLLSSFSDIRRDVVVRGGYLSGFSSYFISFAILKMGSMMYYKDMNHALSSAILTGSYVLSYPFRLNSINKALNLPEFKQISLDSIVDLVKNKVYYRGLLFEALGQFVSLIPGLNYMYNSIEQTRIAFILGNQKGLKFEKYSDAANYIKDNGNYARGRLLTTTYFTLYNVFAIVYLFLWRKNCQRAKKETN